MTATDKFKHEHTSAHQVQTITCTLCYEINITSSNN